MYLLLLCQLPTGMDSGGGATSYLPKIFEIDHDMLELGKHQ
jgi:hypothetical protein